MANIEMTFALPELEKANCKSFTACAQVVAKGKPRSKFFSDRKPLVASIGQGKSKRFARLFVQKSGHLHLDIATPALFRDGGNPKAPHSWQQIQSWLGRFAGQEFQVRAEAIFSVPVQNLPESGFIQILSVKSPSQQVSMKLTGGTFSVTGAPVQRIAWSLEGDGKGVEVRLRCT